MMMYNIAIGKGSFIDDSTTSTIIPNCHLTMLGAINKCFHANETNSFAVVNATAIQTSDC